MMNTVLIIDDEEKLRSLLARLISMEGFLVMEAANIKAAKKAVEKEEPDVILCDVKLPDGNGVDFINDIKSKFFTCEIILLTAYGNIADGIQAMKNGAFDYIVKGNDNDKIIPLIYKAVEKTELKKKIALLEKQTARIYTFENIIGKSTPIIDATGLAKKAAPTDATILLLGETGTGKEVFAQAIHNASARKHKSFMAFNCSAFTKDLIESEIFGHKAGAFTGALKNKKGLIEEANGGTLFLDEIGEMPFELQAKLLRVLETNEFIKVGDTQVTRINIRVIAATNRNLAKDVADSKFREDLFYRLNTFTISLPPLRERVKDIPALADHFLKIFSAKANTFIKGMDKTFIEKLQQHEWKGNIRELKNVIERAVIIATTPELTIDNLPLELRTPGNTVSSASSLDMASVEKNHIAKVLLYTKGNKAEAAKLMNIGVATLYRKIEEYGLS